MIRSGQVPIENILQELTTAKSQMYCLVSSMILGLVRVSTRHHRARLRFAPHEARPLSDMALNPASRVIDDVLFYFYYDDS